MNGNTFLHYKSILVIGLGISGRSAIEFLLGNKANVWGVDKNIDLLRDDEQVAALRSKGLKTSHENDFIDIHNFDLVITSPGIPQTHHLFLSAKQAGIEIIGEVELACRFLQNPILGITGTNGKTTVTLLVTHILKFNGKAACALGNVGVPLTAELLHFSSNDTNKIIVAELSSFQLDTLNAKVLSAAVILNITPDHLDRYSNMEAYAKSKIHIKDCLKQSGKLYMEEDAFKNYHHLLEGFKPELYGYGSTNTVYTDKKNVIFKEIIEHLLPLEYRGIVSHDLENLLAAYGLCREIGITPEQFFEALPSFQKPQYRIEFVRKIAGVAYYDDSKGTNVDAVIRAVESLQGKIILIAGGVDKGSSYEPWLHRFKGRVKYMCAIGQASAKIAYELGANIPTKSFESLENAVRFAAAQAEEGDNVLLSPGCASHDMFRNYAHRGDEFKKIVRML
jgi:UDP-N-acetylmuramoylalanine--D-glutamate ligase